MMKLLMQKKFLFLILMQFCLIGSYYLFANITGVILPIKGQPDILHMSFLWQFPFSILITFLYFWMTNHYRIQKSFMIFLLSFSSLFLFYILGVHPHYDVFHVSPEIHKDLLSQYPGFTGLIDFYAYWPEMILLLLARSFYFVFINAFFWQFVIETIPQKESKVVYPIFGFVMGLMVWANDFVLSSLVPYKNPPLNLYMPISIFCSLLGLIFLLQKSIYKGLKPELPLKNRLPILESFGHIFTSSLFALMGFLTILYFMVIKLLHFSNPIVFILFSLIYGFVQLGYHGLPREIQAKSKGIIDIIGATIGLWLGGEIFKIGTIAHMHNKITLNTFVGITSAIFLSIFMIVAYHAIKKLRTKNCS